MFDAEVMNLHNTAIADIIIVPILNPNPIHCSILNIKSNPYGISCKIKRLTLIYVKLKPQRNFVKASTKSFRNNMKRIFDNICSIYNNLC